MEGTFVEFATMTAVLVMTLMGTGRTVFAGGDGQELRLKELAHKDFAMVNRLKALAVNREAPPSSEVLTTIDEYTRYVDEFESGTTSLARVNVTKHAEQAVGNPLVTYKLVSRVSSLFEYLKYEPDVPHELRHQIETEFGNFSNNINDDLSRAVDAILQLQFTYSLPTADLAAGKLGGLQMEVRLNAFNCIQIAVKARKEQKLALAVEWLKETIRLARIDETLELPIARAELLNMIVAHNIKWRQNDGLSKKHLLMRLLTPSDMDMGVAKDVTTVREGLKTQFGGKGRNCSYWQMNYWGLCSGENLHAAHNVSPHLFCWLEFKAHAILRVGPLKIEFISRNPDIVQIYDAFSSQSPSKTAAGNYKNENSSLEVILAASELTTAGRLVASNTTLEVTTELPGAQNKFKLGWHSDGTDEATNLNRDATLMINLNNVEAGGHIVFPAALTSSPVVEGSAVFWFHSLSDGSMDYSSAHAPCPVILGQKLAAQKWLRFSPHSSHCLLKPKERFRVLVNGKLLPVPNPFIHELITQKDYEKPMPLTAYEHRNLLLVKGGWDGRMMRRYGYNTMRSLRPLIRLDLEIYQNLKRIIASGGSTVENSSDPLQAYLETFNERAYEPIMATTDYAAVNEKLVSKLAENPLAIYRAIYRFENYVKKWILDPGQDEEVLRKCIVEVYRNVIDGPTSQDLEFSMVGILSIQQAYDLDTEDIAKGLVAGVDTGIQLTAQECIQFGYEAIISDYLFSGVQWMETALRKIRSHYTGRPPADKQLLEEAQLALETAKEAHDTHLDRSKGQHSFTYTEPVRDLSSIPSSLKTNKEIQYNQHKFSTDLKHARINYCGLCQGKTHKTATEQSKLFCWYESDMDPYWKIGPLKAELLSMHPKPEVVQFHDFLTQEDIQFLRNDTNNDKPHDFQPSNTAGGANPVERLGAVLWYNLSRSQESVKIKKIAERATGLKIVEDTWAMKIQIGVYTPGSHYNVHHDTVNYDITDDPYRMATFMFYVNDVEKGGATAFAQAGVRVPPKAGSAVLWYNMLSSGVLDPLTAHGSCPVIFGQKLIATIWFEYGDQTHLKCHVDQQRRLEVFVNEKSKNARQGTLL